MLMMTSLDTVLAIKAVTKMSSFEYVKQHYGVPAEIGRIVETQG